MVCVYHHTASTTLISTFVSLHGESDIPRGFAFVGKLGCMLKLYVCLPLAESLQMSCTYMFHGTLYREPIYNASLDLQKLEVTRLLK